MDLVHIPSIYAWNNFYPIKKCNRRNPMDQKKNPIKDKVTVPSHLAPSWRDM